MKKCLIILWYGKFPNYFHLFLKSCSWNPSWNWLIFTDQKTNTLNIPKNVSFINTTFKELTKLINKRLGIELSLKIQPYKLCDLKPMYGQIFSDFLNGGGYDYWGHCDNDIIWGNLSKFYPDSLIKQYDRFLCWGHLTLYRNSESNNTFYKKAVFKYFDYRTIIASKYNWGFDEYRKYALLRIQEKTPNYKIYKNRQAIADISPWDGYRNIKSVEHGTKSELKPLEYIKVDNGAVYLKYVSETKEEEMAYAHFQKRSFDVLDVSDESKYYVLCNTICDDPDYKGKQIIKRDNRLLSIRITQICKIIEIIRLRYI